jgi:chemotaxis regulatin CheY-phosphate phosphatase CheZ
MVGRFLRREKSYAEAISAKWRKESLRALRDLDKSSRSLVSAREEFDHRMSKAEEMINSARESYEDAVARTERSVESAKDTFDRYDHIDETLHEQLKIVRDVMIPGLTTSNEMLRQQIEAYIAMQVQIQTAHAPRPREV